jgi:hypothetical protein
MFHAAAAKCRMIFFRKILYYSKKIFAQVQKNVHITSLLSLKTPQGNKQYYFGRLAQLVQSACLTSRMSGVQIPHCPHKTSNGDSYQSLHFVFATILTTRRIFSFICTLFLMGRTGTSFVIANSSFFFKAKTCESLVAHHSLWRKYAKDILHFRAHNA